MSRNDIAIDAQSSLQSRTSREEQALVLEWRSHIRAAEAAISRTDWDIALTEAKLAAALAEQLREPRYLRPAGNVLLTLSSWGTSARLFAIAERIEEPQGPPEWDGMPSSEMTLLILERRSEHVGRPIRFARFIPIAAARVKRCIVLVDPRLVKLFRRTFPSVDVRAHGIDDARSLLEADAVAGYHTLIRHFGFDDHALRAGFTPLRADRELVDEMRRRYGHGSRPLIGISWTSTNMKKLRPALKDWYKFILSFDATFVSLQYGNVSGDVSVLCEASTRNFIYDESIDSLVDLDVYAAQVAAMDAVVSISGTCGHVAGALGKRTFVPLDDKTLLYWPATGSSISWYPSTTFFRRQGRCWQAVFERIRNELSAYVS